MSVQSDASVPTWDFAFDQGMTYNFNFIVKDSSGVPVDLTGHTFSSSFKRNVTDHAPAFSIACALADQTNSATKGMVSMTLNGADTAAISRTSVSAGHFGEQVLVGDLRSVSGGNTVIYYTAKFTMKQTVSV